MTRFTEGDRVRIDIPNQGDLDHGKYHGEHGTSQSVLTDDLSRLTGITAESRIYRVELDLGEMEDFRERDLRPPLD